MIKKACSVTDSVMGTHRAGRVIFFLCFYAVIISRDIPIMLLPAKDGMNDIRREAL